MSYVGKCFSVPIRKILFSKTNHIYMSLTLARGQLSMTFYISTLKSIHHFKWGTTWGNPVHALSPGTSACPSAGSEFCLGTEQIESRGDNKLNDLKSWPVCQIPCRIMR